MRCYRKKTNCRDCPLAEKTEVRGIGPRGSKIVFIGEAPGAEEDESGFPFVGPAGKYFTGGLQEVGLDRNRCWVTNVLSCRPPNNEFNSLEGREAQKCCTPGFFEELDWLVEEGAKVFVPLGNNACSTLGLPPGIFKIRGSVYTDPRWPGIPILPTFHPSFLNRRTMGKKYSGGDDPNPITVDPKFIWWADLKKAKRLSEEGWSPPLEDFNLFPTLEELDDFAKRVLSQKSQIAVDIETTGFNHQYALIVVIGLADSATSGISIPLLKQGASPYWKNGDQKFVRDTVSSIFQGCPLLFQNALFDIPFLQRDGFEIDYSRVQDDIMLLHHCLTGDTIIDTLEGPKPIQDLEGKENFWLVSHDGEKLTPKRAKACWKTSKRSDLVRITFWNKDRIDKSKMWIDCTEDHEIPIQGKGKVQAKDLKPGDRLFRGQQNKHRIGGELIHHWVYREHFGEDIKYPYQVHHLDGNHWNNSPENLQKVTASEHNAYHKESQYRAVIQMQRNTYKRLRKELNTETVHSLYFKVGLSLREVAEELETSPDRIQALFKMMKWKCRSRGEANRLRWEKERNCRVISVTPLKGAQDVYDIEVPETHTFSANGVIVGNSVCPELPHNLGFIVSLYGDTPYWKEDFLNRTESILSLDDEELRTYNLRDCAVLHQVLPGLRKDLEDLGTERVYREESLALLSPIADMKKWGIRVDRGRLTRYRAKLTREIGESEKKLRKDFSFPKVFKFSDQELGWFLYGQEPTRFSKLEELREYDPETTTKKKPLSKETKKYRELLEIREVKEKAKNLYYPTGWKGRKSRKTGRLKTDDQGRLSYQIALQNRLAIMGRFKKISEKHQNEIETINRLLTFLKDLNELKRMKKELTTYTTFKIDPDGRVRNSFLIHGTATGRLACRA